MLKLRPATLEDAEGILSIYAPYVMNTAVSFEYEVPSIEAFRERMTGIMKDYPYIVAEDENGIAGYAYASLFHSRKAYRHSVETSIYVKSSERKKGIGKALYAELERILMKQNVFVLYACITCTDREDDEHLTRASIDFHNHMGYKHVGIHELCGYKFDKWYSVCWMEKLIKERPLHPEEFIPFTMDIY